MIKFSPLSPCLPCPPCLISTPQFKIDRLLQYIDQNYYAKYSTKLKYKTLYMENKRTVRSEIKAKAKAKISGYDEGQNLLPFIRNFTNFISSCWFMNWFSHRSGTKCSLEIRINSLLCDFNIVWFFFASHRFAIVFNCRN